MSLVVNTNVASLSATNALGKTTRNLGSTLSHLSSGLRITKAGDDAAGLGVAENLDNMARSAVVARRNINDGVSVIAITEGGLGEVADILKRMRELAIQSASETLASTERAYIQDEFTQLSDEVDRIANVMEFNGIKVADGSNTTLAVQVGVQNTTADQIDITLADFRATVLGVDTASMDLSTATGAQTAITNLDAGVDKVNSERSKLGAVQNRLESALNNIETYHENLKAAESRIRDADFAYETAELAKQQIMQQAGVSVLAQAKGFSQAALSLLG